MLMGLLALGVVAGKIKTANGTVPLSSRVKIRMMNNRGPYIAVIVPYSFEMNPLLRSPSFRADPNFPYLDILGKGKLELWSQLVHLVCPPIILSSYSQFT